MKITFIIIPLLLLTSYLSSQTIEKYNWASVKIAGEWSDYYEATTVVVYNYLGTGDINIMLASGIQIYITVATDEVEVTNEFEVKHSIQGVDASGVWVAGIYDNNSFMWCYPDIELWYSYIKGK